MIDIEKIRAETPGIEFSTHLLACGSSLMPKNVVDAIIQHTQLEALMGGYEAEAKKADELNNIYNIVAKHIGANSHEIALMENSTVAWSHAFYALPLNPGSKILTSEAEYAANYVAFLQRAKRDNLTIDIVPSDESGTLDVNALESMIDEEVGLIAISWIPTNGGLVNPAERVGLIAKKYNIPYLLDACQAAGQMSIDVEKIACDFLSATGRKFLRGPRGTGFLYIKDKWLSTIEPAMIDHFGAPWVSKNVYELREDARRFETWENSYALRIGLGEAITYAEEIGIDLIQERVQLLARLNRKLLSEVKNVQVRDIGTEKCGIISFSIEEEKNSKKIVDQMSEAGFTIGLVDPESTLIDSEKRELPTLLRMAPHYYNTEEEIEKAVKQLSLLL
jgi:selenocysteine lyase/cysteine desulfurase|tara:strand:+ start:543 stop:1718 length:1176 start_codon:yes stop_codon:yes gene_type:complete